MNVILVEEYLFAKSKSVEKTAKSDNVVGKIRFVFLETGFVTVRCQL